eukprot:9934754-Lingulodinium_polyedra.AAC.1
MREAKEKVAKVWSQGGRIACHPPLVAPPCAPTSGEWYSHCWGLPGATVSSRSRSVGPLRGVYSGIAPKPLGPSLG